MAPSDKRCRPSQSLWLGVLVSLLAVGLAVGGRQQAVQAVGSPISHVVVIMMENRTFDNVLGYLCVQESNRCDGSTTEKLSDGSTRTLAQAPDVQPGLNHSHESTETCIDGGAMDGCNLIDGCKEQECYDQYIPSQIPNLAALADTFTISDRTFTSYTSASWVAHLELAAGTRDGFYGDNPQYNNPPQQGPGWGCDSYKDAAWRNPVLQEPSCIPNAEGTGPWPYRASPVKYVPTIMDRMDGAGLSWNIYVDKITEGRSICSYFVDCLTTEQANDVTPTDRLASDASAGTLPNLSFVIPKDLNSEHPTWSMSVGDNWLGQQLQALMTGPEWPSTAVFITWDDCGCFPDHVNPLQYNATWGERVPMVIVSPYALPQGVDSTPATFGSILAYIENNWGLAPLAEEDTGAYDYSNAFDYAQPPISPPRLLQRLVPASTRRYLTAHPGIHEES